MHRPSLPPPEFRWRNVMIPRTGRPRDSFDTQGAHMKIKQLGATIVFLAGSGMALAESAPPAASDGAAPPAVEAKPAAVQAPAASSPCPAGCNGLDGCGHAHGYKSYNPDEEIPYSLNSRFYGNLEYILWWQKTTQFPTLIDTGAAATE